MYTNHVKDMISEGSRRILVNINDLRRKNVGRAQALLRKADEEILAFNRALKEFIASIQPDLAKVEENFYVGFDGCFGDRYLTPRTLTSKWVLEEFIVFLYLKIYYPFQIHWQSPLRRRHRHQSLTRAAQNHAQRSLLPSYKENYRAKAFRPPIARRSNKQRCLSH